jgi:hypothetical protein
VSASVPEPSTVILVGLVLLALVGVGWLQSRKMRGRRKDASPEKKTEGAGSRRPPG